METKEAPAAPVRMAAGMAMSRRRRYWARAPSNLKGLRLTSHGKGRRLTSLVSDCEGAMVGR